MFLRESNPASESSESGVVLGLSSLKDEGLVFDEDEVVLSSAHLASCISFRPVLPPGPADTLRRFSILEERRLCL